PEERTNPRGPEIWREFEVALAYSARQILQKPEGVSWITSCTTQADTIEQAVRRRAHMITTVTSLNPKRDEAPIPLIDDFPTKNRADLKILTALREIGGAATAEGLAAITGDDRANISRVLNRLTDQNAIAKSYARFQPGCLSGRSLAVYGLPGVALTTFQSRLSALIRSDLAVEMRDQGYLLSRFLTNDQALVFAPEDTMRPSILIFVDDLALSPDDLQQRIKNALGSQPVKSAAAYYASAAADRLALLRTSGLPVEPWDVIKRRETRRQGGPKVQLGAVPSQA
ncbi:MAG: hypothetical protein ACREAC_11745, partial [Blastocatellia bacterium]